MTKTRQLTRRSIVGAGLAAPLIASGIGSAQAQAKTITVLLPFSPGSGVDATTRAAQNELAKALNATLVLNNQPGAGGVIGGQMLVKAAPDGTTVSMISTNHVIYPSVLKAVPFDPVGDFTAIGIMGATPLVMVANPKKISAKNAKELTALLKANPDKHTYASSGNGTILHFAAAMYVDQAGVKVTHVPYKGVGPMVTDLLGGQVDFGVLAYPSVASHIKSGALVAIGTATPKRIGPLPDLQTFIEQGMPNYVCEAWFGMIGPAKMDPAEVARFNKAIATAFESAEVKAAMEKLGNTYALQTPAQSTDFLKSELKKYADLAKAIKLEAQ